MGRCKNQDTLKKITLTALQHTTRVAFAVLDVADNCTRINAQNYFALVGQNPVYNRFQRPEDRFNCRSEGCVNTGTLTLHSVTQGTDPDEEVVVSATYKVPYDATEFVGGLTSYYVYFAQAGTYEIETTIGDIADETLSNADVYVQTITITDPGYYPIVVDFGQVPDSEVGTGWTATEAGAIIKVQIENTAGDAFDAGLSSFYFYDTIEDFQTNEVVEMDCLSEITSDLTVDAIDAECARGGYDPTSLGFEYTITGKKITPNYHLLNPLEGKGELAEGWELQGDKRKVQSRVINGITYGYIQVPDMKMDECAWTKVMLDDACDVHEADLFRVNVPVPIAINERQFIVLDGTTTAALDGGLILLHESLIGQIVVVEYPRARQVERYVGNDENLNKKKVEMYVPVCYEDKVRETRKYCVLITSFPLSITQDETEFSFTITVQKCKDGNWYERDIIKE